MVIGGFPMDAQRDVAARAKEWKQGLSRAFDCVPRGAVLEASHELGASPWEMFALLSTLRDLWVFQWQDYQFEHSAHDESCPSTSRQLY
eukprot:515110-Amphidinium_carterae.1